MSNKVSEAELLRISSMMYEPDWYDKVRPEPFIVNEFNHGSVTFKVLGSTAVNKDFEKNGLQASYLEVNGQKVIAFRGSQGFGTEEGNRDWAQDLGLNDSDAYLKGNSQSKDAANWIATLGLSPEELRNVIFTGHSLGGGLASWAAVKYDAQGTVFSAPSAYNMLTPMERLKIGNARVENFRQHNDSISEVPIGVPRIGKQTLVKGNGKVSDVQTGILASVLGVLGHFQDSFVLEGDSLSRGTAIEQRVNSPLTVIIGTLGFTSEQVWKNLKFTGLPGIVTGSIGHGSGYGKLLFDAAFNGTAETFIDNASDQVKKIQKENNRIPDEMRRIYETNILATASSWSWLLSVQDIENEVHKRNLYYRNHYNQGKVDEVNRKLIKELADLKLIKSAIKKVISSQSQLDKKAASEMRSK